MKKYILTILFVCLFTSKALGCDVQCEVTPSNAWGYYQADHFRWYDPDTQVHLLVGFGGSLLISQALTHYVGLKPWQSAIIGTLVVGLAGTTKEVMFDTYTGRTDIKSYWAGALTGGLTFTVLTF